MDADAGATDAGGDEMPSADVAVDAPVDAAEAGRDVDATDVTDGGRIDASTNDASDADNDARDAADAPLDVFVPCSEDSDSDGVFDDVEGRFDATGAPDTDGDGAPDYLDPDSDDDGIPDGVETPDRSCAPGAGNDADGDGIANARDTDSDGNGLPDRDEACPPAGVLARLGRDPCAVDAPLDFDGDGTPDYLDPDNDHDAASSDPSAGLDDAVELRSNAGTYVGLVDTDGDGVPDLWDRDADNDNIFDLDDGAGDRDADGVPNFRDRDADGDAVPDTCEARANAAAPPSDSEAGQPLRDTDLDGVPDFLDRDSDGDQLPDGLEDRDGDCVVDINESDRTRPDTDGDGAGDLAEVALLGAAAAHDAATTPAQAGKFYFVAPYAADGSALPRPASAPIAIATPLKLDLAFVLDTTTAMNGITSNLPGALSTDVFPLLTAAGNDFRAGVIGYDDALAKPWGDSTGDSFVWFPNGYATGSAMGTAADALAAANRLTRISPGGNYPEGTIPALWWALTGDSFLFHSSAAGTTKSFTSGTPPDANHFGGLHFRDDALTVVVNSSDANMVNGLTTGCSTPAGTTAIPSSLCFPLSYAPDAAAASSLGHAPLLTELVGRLRLLDVRYLGVSVHGPGGSLSTAVNRTTDPSYYASAVDMLYLARQTGSKASPALLGGTTADCRTSEPGATAPNPADSDSLCPLVFDIAYSGSGLGTVLSRGLTALLGSVQYDVFARASGTAVGDVNPVDAFVQSITPSPSGGTDPITGGVCVTFPASRLRDVLAGPGASAGSDGVDETIGSTNPGPRYCFSVTPRANATVPPTPAPQVYQVTIQALAARPMGGRITLGAARDVFFIVPPVID